MRMALTAVALAAAMPALAMANCPPMNVYELNGVTANNLPLKSALDLLTTGTAWHAEVRPGADAVRVSYTGVSGRLDDVVQAVLRQARTGGEQIASVSDPTNCTLTVSMVIPAAPAATVPVAPAAPLNLDPAKAISTALTPVASQHAGMLRKGKRLSEAMAEYVQTFGWTLRWRIDSDYVLDANVPVPSMTMVDGVTWIVRAYQFAGGLEGVVPKINKGNNVVSIIPMESPDDQGGL